jgi:hypothetical protein
VAAADPLRRRRRPGRGAALILEHERRIMPPATRAQLAEMKREAEVLTRI